MQMPQERHHQRVYILHPQQCIDHQQSASCLCPPASAWHRGTRAPARPGPAHGRLLAPPHAQTCARAHDMAATGSAMGSTPAACSLPGAFTGAHPGRTCRAPWRSSAQPGAPVRWYRSSAAPPLACWAPTCQARLVTPEGHRLRQTCRCQASRRTVTSQGGSDSRAHLESISTVANSAPWYVSSTLSPTLMSSESVSSTTGSPNSSPPWPADPVRHIQEHRQIMFCLNAAQPLTTPGMQEL